MEIYVAYMFGRTPEDDEKEKDEMGVTHVTKAWGEVVISRRTRLADAQADAEAAFLAEPASDRSPWVKTTRVWAPARDPAHADELRLWSLLPAAAPAMSDPNRTFYPQMRETHYWVETVTVDGEPPEHGDRAEPPSVPEDYPAVALERFFWPISAGTSRAALVVVRQRNRLLAQVIGMMRRNTGDYEPGAYVTLDITELTRRELVIRDVEIRDQAADPAPLSVGMRARIRAAPEYIEVSVPGGANRETPAPTWIPRCCAAPEPLMEDPFLQRTQTFHQVLYCANCGASLLTLHWAKQ